MGRAGRTYRASRRNDWRKLDGVTWEEHNMREVIGPANWFVGTFPIDRLRRVVIGSRSKYMPHIGKKERARHANKPDGAMHVSGRERAA